MKSIVAAAERFAQEGKVADVREFGSGNINATYLVTLEGGAEGRFVLQRVNTRVFREPALVMNNMRLATGHILSRLERVTPGAGRFEVPRVLQSSEGRDHWIDPGGDFWRALSFIEGARTFDTVRDAVHAREVGRALGLFHMLLGGLPTEGLADTLPGFHVTPRYLSHFGDVLSERGAPRSQEVDYCLRFVGARSAWANVLEDARAGGRLSIRVIHGDPKVDNVLIDDSTGLAAGIVDLDTVKPGLIHYDIGDCLRSACNPLGEETGRPENVRFDLGLCRAVLGGYLPAAREILTGEDLRYIYESIRLIAFELGLRFLTDYLEGNVYFKVSGPEQNLRRALVQFRLLESIESQEAAIRVAVREAAG